MDGKCLLALTLVLAAASAQKLYFKSNRLLHEELQQHEQDKIKHVSGFGFKEPKKYFIGPRKSEESAPKVSADVVVCPGNKSACPTGSTCCLTSTMAYGCCPLPMALCCQDRRHCCPARTRCDVARQACISGEILVPWLEKTPAISLDNNNKIEENPLSIESVQCPDGAHECADGQTCCKSAEEYSCCPLPNVENQVHMESVLCPDGEHECADGQTCCRSREGYSCCPSPNAVCCSDEVHCCPTGTTCDLPHSRCVKQETGEFFNWVEKQPTKTKQQQHDNSRLYQISTSILASESASVRCDDKHVCPTGNTCCRMQDNEWGCCPKPEAQCCEDHAHCCPKGSVCDSKSKSCVNGVERITWSTKQPAIVLEVVKCDGTHECPNGNTCCKLASGSWGCCPLPSAVCCSDNEHCCPHGKTCDVSSGKCNGGDTQLDWFVKVPAKEIGIVQCDSTHECPDRNTCCKLSSGSWGCCPVPNAVCCSDHVHCCPSGTTCDVSQGKCNRGDAQLDWFVKVPANEIGRVQCDATHDCPDRNTCCQLASGSWGCCPIPDAVCCSDHVHCCPSGTTCDVSQGKCNRGDTQLDWFVKVPADEIERVQCDATHDCPDRNTCCQLASGGWGCCPIPDAVCCSDHVHCCPSGTTCDVSQGKCNRGDTQLDWFVKVPANEIGRVQCDATHDCPDRNTCCQLASGGWGCCPIPDAVCCSDHVHCCPTGTTCDVSQGKCNRGDTQLDWFVKVPANEIGRVQCDATHDCPDRNTCCQLASGGWGCCPIPDAVCCSDHVHCCPSGTTCDVSQGKCNRGDAQLDWFVKVPANEIGRVQCDATHDCPDRNTCCQLASGGWGCCPIPDAVCCSDHVHCCPSGTTCDVSQGKCNRGDTQLDWFVKVPANEIGRVQCDATHDCPDRNTCCQLASGGWGCCPIPDAVCCSDHVHCCPSGTTCDVSQGKCNRGDTQLDWFVKVTANEIGRVQCDATHDCPDRNTCCQLASGGWGCCPIPDAVCCSDHVHCCPSGTTCDVSQGKCNRGDTQLDWFVKVTANEIGRVQCDATHDCPDRNTCCQLASGGWGCCPIPDAVCCSDHVHCCPTGTTCDVSQGKCNRGDTQLDWFVKVTANEIGRVQCDATHDCPDRNTCCQLASGGWGCCPIPDAVCCSDHVHCCPSGTTCDVSSGKCNRGDTQLDWFGKVPAKEIRIVQCDSTHFCPDGNTCCKLGSGQWGCCPIPNAVCCSDGVHCCPSGTTCDVSSGKCNRGNISVNWYEKKPAILKLDDVICPDGSECQDDQTCCQMNNGVSSYGCCPLPNAVCCNDGQHCCPQGYRCNLSGGVCFKGHVKLPLIQTKKRKHYSVDTESKNIQNSNHGNIISQNKLKDSETEIHETDVQCPDGRQCPAQNSCCDNGQGGYNCCPMPNGVCCGDHQHCCPHGYICDEEPGICRIPETNTATSNLIRKLGTKSAIPHV